MEESSSVVVDDGGMVLDCRMQSLSLEPWRLEGGLWGSGGSPLLRSRGNLRALGRKLGGRLQKERGFMKLVTDTFQ